MRVELLEAPRGKLWGAPISATRPSSCSLCALLGPWPVAVWEPLLCAPETGLGLA